MNGIYKELQKQYGSSVQNYIIAARTAQGYEDVAGSTQQQRLDAVKRWQATQLELHKEKEGLKHDASNPSSCVFLRIKNATHYSLEERKQHAKGGKLHKDPKHGSSARRESAGTTPASGPSVSAESLLHVDSSTFEEAIQSSVKATSRGDSQEDALIERAIRASVTELRAASKTGDKDEAIQRAIHASVAEAAEARRTSTKGNGSDSPVSDGGLRLALQRSLLCHPSAEIHADDGLKDPGVESGNDEDPEPAVEHPKAAQIEADDDNEHLEKALEQSRLDHEQSQRDLEKQRTEEEIVMEYIKKKSLLEEEHRRSLALLEEAHYKSLASKANANEE